MNILEKIVIEKKKRVIFLKRKYKSKIKIKVKSSFIKKIETNNNNKITSIIAEFKRYSPSKKNFKNSQRIKETILKYETSKATCISILTDKNFGGSLADIKVAKKMTSKPIIRKDFIIDEIQIYESALYQVDAVLLIAKILTEKKIIQLEKCAHSYGLDVLIEIENENDLNKILKSKTKLIGINNRNLAKQNINVNKTKKLSNYINNKIIVSESGITVSNIRGIKKEKINVFLIGGSILDNNNIIKYIERLVKA